MNFSEFRQRHDVIRAERKTLAKETLIKELLDACDSDGERIAAGQLLRSTVGTPLESLTTGMKETWIANHLGLKTKSLIDIRAALPAIWSQRNLERHPWSVLDLHGALRAYCQAPDRTDAARGAILAKALGQPDVDDAFLALEILTAKLSNGVEALTIFYALARRHPDCPFTGNWKDADRSRLRRAFHCNPDTAYWTTAWRNQPFWPVIDGTRPRVGVPANPQLADPGKDLKDLFAGGKRLVYEPKLDGERVHIHVRPNGDVRLFSRQLKDNTAEHPEIVRGVAAAAHLRDSILDGELVALAADGSILPFTFVGRKDDETVARKAVVVYDCLRLAGQDLFDAPFEQRRAAFAPALAGVPCLSLIPQQRLTDLPQLLALVEACHEEGSEGLVVKDLDFATNLGEREGFTKAKAMYDSKLADTVDVVVVGYNKGRGKRHGVIGSLWVAIGDAGVFHPVCKVGTGLKEADLEAWTQRLAEHVLPGKPDSIVAGKVSANVQVWVDPTFVIEVNAAEVSRSPLYSAAADSEGRGLSLRFPVFLRERPDKTPESATTVDDLVRMSRRTA